MPEQPDRPRTRADCLDAPRPCPWVGCKHHLFTEVRPNGTIAYPWGMEVEALEGMRQSCALDVADAGGASWDEVGQALNCSMQNTRLVETSALAKLAAHRLVEELAP